MAVNGLNVLVYSTTVGHSHVKFHNKLADLLVDAGHKVVRRSDIPKS